MVRLTDRPKMTIMFDRGRKATTTYAHRKKSDYMFRFKVLLHFL